jgi:hypothetical protein
MSITPSLTISLEAELSGHFFLNASRSFENSWVILSSDKQFLRRSQDHGALVPPFHFQVHEFNGWAWDLPLKVGPTERRYSFAQPLPDRKWLLIEGRAPRDRSPNAGVFGEKGQIVSSLFLGDGIENVQVSAAGDIWVGYFDEGIFGGGQLERSGLVCFDPQGNPKLQFMPDIADSYAMPPIDDLYALNVCRNGETWCCYYSNFPLVKLKGIKFEQAWTDFPKKAVRAFAIHGNQLLMVPAYQNTGPLYLCDLKKNSIEEVQLTQSDGQPLEFDLTVGRDSTLGFVSVKNPNSPTLYQTNFG